MNLQKNNVFNFMTFNSDEFDFIPILSGNRDNKEQDNLPETLSILPLRNTVLFPKVLIPITIGREKSLQLIREIQGKEKYIGVISQKEINIENPNIEELNTVGTVAKIVKTLQMPDNSNSIIIQGIKRFKIVSYIKTEPYYVAEIVYLEEIFPEANDTEYEAVIGSLKSTSEKIIQLAHHIPREAAFAIKNINNPVFLVNYIAINLDIDTKDKQELLENNNIKERAILLLKYLTIELQKLEIQNDIHKKVKIEIDQQQREYFLTQQMKTIKNELGGDAADIEIGDLRKKASEKNWAQNVADTFEKEVKRLERMHPASPDYSNILTYLHLLLELPWNIFTTDNFDLKNVSKILEKDHFGLEKVKERILEHLAVLKLKGDMKAPIICLYGPPGVGKTSLGKSVAEALNRKYVRISLGGLHDEAEIRGHRKTYIGALPGRIIQNIKKAKSSNPVFILDEIDKIGNDFRGNPSFALLEVLDPEQNSAFYDNYLELEYDLSKVLFIATANSLNSIDSALLDRMELIHVSGYIVEEKIEISKRHLLPKLLENHGINKEQLKFSDEVIEHVIVNYTRESGVRELNNTFAKIARFVAKKIGLEQKYNPKISIKDVRKILGAPIYINRDYQECKYAGVATGLAWTPAGGKILYVETSLSKGNGRLTLTGNLGEVMKESAVIALEYVKAHATDLNIATEIFDTWNLHIHVPEGAIPKDGPSAGITIASSIASAFSQRRVKPHTALTGEITLRGSVLPVGGIKEKILAAKRAQINEIILPAANKNDVEEIKEIYTAGLTFHYVENILEVFNIFLLNEQVENPMVFKKKEIENQKP